MPHSRVAYGDGSTASQNNQTFRDTVRANPDDSHFFAGPNAAPRLFDDFCGKTISGAWASTKGSDGGCADWANTVTLNGAAVATTGAGGTTTMAVNGVQLDAGTAGLQWKASSGGLTFECRLKTSAITQLALFCGFTDQVSSLEMPWTLSTTTFTANASDGCGFLFDTSATTVTIRCVGVKADTKATSINTSLAYVADTYRKFRIELSASGDAFFWVDDTYQGTVASATTAGTFLTPVIAGFSRSAASRTISADYVLVQATRV